MSEAATTTAVAKSEKQIDIGNDGLILRDFSDLWRFAVAASKSELVPKDYRGKPENILIAVQHGREIRLRPMQSLQSIAVVNGRATIWGDAIPGLLWGSGLLVDMKEWIDGEGDARIAHCELKRLGAETPIHRTFSVADAKTAGLWQKRGREGGPTPWVTYPQRMLTWRARSWAARDGFADVLRGLQVREEVQDYCDVREPERVETTEPPRLSLLPGNVDASSSQEPETELPDVNDVGTELTTAVQAATSLELLEGIRGEVDQAIERGDILQGQYDVIAGLIRLKAKSLQQSNEAGALF